MTTPATLTLIRLGSAKSLTLANFPLGEPEPVEFTDKYGI
jgi:hypothetical protein